MNARGPISGGDLVDAVRALARSDWEDLAPCDALCAAVAEMLGIEWSPPGDEAPAVEPELPVEPQAERPSTTSVEPELPRPEPPPVEPEPTVRDEPTSAALRAIIRPSVAATRLAPDWLERVEPLPADKSPGERREPAPLFEPQRTRSILGMTLATPVPEGEIELDPVIATIARGRPLTRVPRRDVMTLARGVQLLVDRSDAMLPFLPDTRRIERDVRRLVGNDALRVLRFEHNPLRSAGGRGRRWWKPYAEAHVPEAGTRIVAVTDLGLGGASAHGVPSPPEEWLAFARLAQQHECHLVILTPYARWSPRLARALSIVRWHEGATAGAVARVVRRGRCSGGGEALR